MADDYDYQGLMSGFAGAFFGAIIGGFIGIIIYVIMSALNIGDSTVQFVVATICLIVGAVLLGIREYKRHGEKKQQ